MKTQKLSLTILLALMLAGAGAQGEELDSTIRKIKSTGTITFGFHPQSFPLTYLDDQKSVIGYAQDLVEQISQTVKQQLNLPKLEVKQTPITYQNRFDQVARGVIDLECNSTTNTLERQKQFAFSNTFFVATTRLLTRKDSGVKNFQDLAGRRVLTLGNSTSELMLKKFSADKKLFFEILTNTDMGAAPITMLQTGQVDAYMLDDILLYGHIANSTRPQDWIVTGTPMSREAYGCMMRKDSPAFKAMVDSAISQWMISGRARTQYKKWFQSPIPPADTNLNFPMSEDMEALFRNPNDRAFE